jgi:hypothetical protein
MHLPFAEAENGAAQRTPGIRIGESGPHLLAAPRHLLGEYGGDEVLTRREVPVDRGDTHVRAPGDLAHWQVQPVRGEGGPRDLQEPPAVVLGVRPRFPSQCAPRTSHFPPSGTAVPFPLLP